MKAPVFVDVAALRAERFQAMKLRKLRARKRYLKRYARIGRLACRR